MDAMWRGLSEAAPVEESANTRYYAASDAPRCPEIDVMTVTDQEVELEPGTRRFARPGCVTLVVFWNTDTRQGQALARYTSELVWKYRRWQVRGVGIVEKTPGAGRAPAFADQHGLRFPLYYDDLSALEEMSDTADAPQETAVPSIFIVDRKGRLRFYRGGFRFAATRVERREVIQESAPAGRAIEDYLKRILSES
jgi:peroxiredoxin